MSAFTPAALPFGPELIVLLLLILMAAPVLAVHYLRSAVGSRSADERDDPPENG